MKNSSVDRTSCACSTLSQPAPRTMRRTNQKKVIRLNKTVKKSFDIPTDQSRRKVVIKHLNQLFTSFQIKRFRAQCNFTVTSLSVIFQGSSCIMKETDPLYSSSIVNCVLNAFSAYTDCYNVEHFNNPCYEKNFVVT